MQEIFIVFLLVHHSPFSNRIYRVFFFTQTALQCLALSFRIKRLQIHWKSVPLPPQKIGMLLRT